MINVGIVIFDEVDVLDFAGPFEVFGISLDAKSQALFNVFTVAEKRHIKAQNGLLIQANYLFYHHPEIDVLVIAGGSAAKVVELHNPEMKRWLSQVQPDCKITLSISTGSFILAEMGLLNGRSATTHHLDIERMTLDYPRIEVIDQVQYVDQGHIISAAGGTSALYASLYVVAKLTESSVAEATAGYMAFDWRDDHADK